MAADLHKEAKTFSVSEDNSGKKENAFGGLYGRLRSVDWKQQTAKDRKKWFFGLSSSEESYVWAGLESGKDIFRRTDRSSFNGFRMKKTEYHPSNGKKSEHRSYLGGVFKTGVE